GGRDLSDAPAGLAVHTRHRPAVAHADAFGPGRTGVAGAADGRSPLTLIGQTIAVVVDPVADLRGGGPGDTGDRNALGAIRYRARGGADAAGRAARAVVGHAVAVVVDAVTGLVGARMR